MPLTQLELDFLAPLVHEGQATPFTGPATEALKAKGIYPAEIPHLEKAYIIYEATQNPDKMPPFGHQNSTLPPCPWESREEAADRDREIQVELEHVVIQKSNLN